MSLPLTDTQRRLIHDLALDARDLLTSEARELLEGTYGLYADGRLDPIEKLPAVLADPEAGGTYRRLARFIDDETRAGLPRPEAVEKLTREIAFTHLNRLVAFKMMEARKLIRGALDKGVSSNGFKFYLADPAHVEDLALYERGDVDTAYRRFLLWQAGQVARELRVLFDPDSLPSRLFPRPRALGKLVTMLNQADLAPLWQADETIGWLYQFFNEREKSGVFDRLYNDKQKLRRQDIPAATQLFTPNWIVRFLVQNTLGRLWVEMHPDTQLLGTELLDYLVPLDAPACSEAPAQQPAPRPRPKLRPIREITLLDPACGGMHFGLVAFDLFDAMYREELERAGEEGWPAAASVPDVEAIPAAIIEHNIFGIDIDLRAVQLSALALYLKAKSFNPKAQIAASNLVCADVLPLNGARLGTFLAEARFTRPVYERLIRALWDRLRDVNQVGSLMRLEREMGALIEQERARVGATPLFAGVGDEFEREAAEAEYWDLISAQIIQALDEFARQQARAGADQTFFAAEAVKGLRLTELMLRDYDVVVTNPPYARRRNVNDLLGIYLDKEYPDAKGDLYAAFIQRCSELVAVGGRLGMITQQSFMFISTYEKLRRRLREQFANEGMPHVGPRAFVEITGEKVNTTVFTLRSEQNPERRERSVGVYFRLVNAPGGDGKRLAFESALGTGANTYKIAQRRFSEIPGEPWVYWITDSLRKLFRDNESLGNLADIGQGMTTADNDRFLRFWWELGTERIGFRVPSRDAAQAGQCGWFPYMKGGGSLRWYGHQDLAINWRNDGVEIKATGRATVRNSHRYFHHGITWSSLGSKWFSARVMPVGFLFDDKGSSCQIADHLANRTLGFLNSSLATYFLNLLNPSVSFQSGDISRLPLRAQGTTEGLDNLVSRATRVAKNVSYTLENTFDFVSPSQRLAVQTGETLDQERLDSIQSAVDEGIYRLYGVGEEDRAAIEAELTKGVAIEGDDGATDTDPQREVEQGQDSTAEGVPGQDELAVRWISYAVGIVLGRFQPGIPGSLGSAVYRRSDFAIGSLPAPDEAEFDDLVGQADRFAFVDSEGGRHLFTPEVEAALRNLALPDGIAVLDEGHPRDLPTLVGRALALMLPAGELAELQATIGTDLRPFLSKDFFTRWHLRWYRKRPVYWPLQSAKRSYGFVLFHERVGRMTLYTLQREYLDYKINAVRQQGLDLAKVKALQSGAAKRATEREEGRVAALLDELTEFAKTIDQVVRGGYEPEPNWIDDGVILRLAPLWELLPLWKAEPKKYWERLQRGDFDWSHIAMKYWPERVREKCKTNRSFAIAHGHEEWFGGR